MFTIPNVVNNTELILSGRRQLKSHSTTTKITHENHTYNETVFCKLTEMRLLSKENFQKTSVINFIVMDAVTQCAFSVLLVISLFTETPHSQFTGYCYFRSNISIYHTFFE